jgi:hypothetical protein
MNFFLSTLDEHQRRLYVGLESKRFGHGGDEQLALITGMNVDTIAKGRHELEQAEPTNRIRAPGGGRIPVEKRPDNPDRSGSSAGRSDGRRSVQPTQMETQEPASVE